MFQSLDLIKITYNYDEDISLKRNEYIALTHSHLFISLHFYQTTLNLLDSVNLQNQISQSLCLPCPSLFSLRGGVSEHIEVHFSSLFTK